MVYTNTFYLYLFHTLLLFDKMNPQMAQLSKLLLAVPTSKPFKLETVSNDMFGFVANNKQYFFATCNNSERKVYMFAPLMDLSFKDQEELDQSKLDKKAKKLGVAITRVRNQYPEKQKYGDIVQFEGTPRIVYQMQIPFEALKPGFPEEQFTVWFKSCLDDFWFTRFKAVDFQMNSQSDRIKKKRAKQQKQEIAEEQQQERKQKQKRAATGTKTKSLPKPFKKMLQSVLGRYRRGSRLEASR